MALVASIINICFIIMRGSLDILDDCSKPHMIIDAAEQKISCVMWSNLANWWLLHVTNLQRTLSCRDLCVMTSNFAPYNKIDCNVEQMGDSSTWQIYNAVLSWFTLFWHKITFVAIYALLCGAKINQQILSVETKWQISCMLQTVQYWSRPDLPGTSKYF